MKRISYLFFIQILNFLLFIIPFNFFRIALLRASGAHVKFSTYIARGIKVDFPWRIIIGINCYISKGVYLDGRGGNIMIGDNVDISMDAILFTLSHNINSEDFSIVKGDIFVCKRAWICARAIILPSAYVASGSVIGANSVFGGKSKPYELLRGIPAAHVKFLSSSRSKSVRA